VPHVVELSFYTHFKFKLPIQQTHTTLLLYQYIIIIMKLNIVIVAILALVLACVCFGSTLAARESPVKKTLSYCDVCTKKVPQMDEQRNKTCAQWGGHSPMCLAIKQTHELAKKNCKEQCEMLARHNRLQQKARSKN
jgi:hypothetical protein